MRHGVTEWNLAKRIQGRQDVPLSNTGRDQIFSTAQVLQNIEVSFSVLIASPLQRAKESAEIMASVLNVPVRLEPTFTERGFGVLEGLTKPEWEHVTNGINPEQIGDGAYGTESFATLEQRLTTGIKHLRTTYAGKQILVVTHGSIIYRLGELFNEPVGLIANAKWVEFKGEKAHAYLYSRR